MKGRFFERTEEEKKALAERFKSMLAWSECEGCKKRKEYLLRKYGEIKSAIRGDKNGTGN